MFIQTEKTPNPATIKFIPGQTVLQSGTAEFKAVGEAGASPLAQRLFMLQGVRSVFLTRDFISVTKADDTDWVMLKPMVLGALMEHLSTGQPIMLERSAPQNNAQDDDEIIVQIKALIEQRIRPGVAMDGGDIEFDQFDHDTGVLYLRLKGACSGCPSSTVTLKMGIENMMRHFVPEVREVRAAPDHY